jgi:uncharacterized protein with PQ loop repeat
MDGAADWLPVAAAVFAVPQFLPQLVRLWRTGDAAGVSWSWAALTCVGNGGWIAYFAAFHRWTALVPAISATALAGVLALALGRRSAERPGATDTIGAPTGSTTRARPGVTIGVMIVIGWATLLALAWVAAGPRGLGIVLTGSFVLQVTPSVWSAYRTERPTGVSRGTWLLILAELSCWGLYGLHISDPRLIVLGATGVIASAAVLLRVRARPLSHVDSAVDTTVGRAAADL